LRGGNDDCTVTSSSVDDVETRLVRRVGGRQALDLLVEKHRLGVPSLLSGSIPAVQHHLLGHLLIAAALPLRPQGTWHRLTHVFYYKRSASP